MDAISDAYLLSTRSIEQAREDHEVNIYKTENGFKLEARVFQTQTRPNEHDITAVESMDDARDLIIWMRQNADSLNLDPNQITAYGWSAGAHLVSSAAIFPESDPVTHFSSIPDALVLVSPPTLAHGNCCELHIYDGVGHLFTPSSMPDNRWPRPDQEIQQQAFDQVDEFLERLGFME